MTDLGQEIVLLLEDQPLIAIDMEEVLERAGFSVQICSSCVDAIRWLDENSPRVAVIETRLADGPSDEIAARLTARGIPYIVHSGDESHDGARPLVAGMHRWFNKPCDTDDFIAAVRECRLLSAT